MQRTNIIEITKKIGQEVLLKGWVHSVRDTGKIIFIQLRDVTGRAQCVAWHKDEAAFKLTKELKTEDVMEIKGVVNARPENQVNNEIETGSIEIAIKEIKIINQAQKALPFEINKDKFKEETKEELRLKYRYLDLRRIKMKENLILRHKINQFFRGYLSEQGFYEIETPILTKGTPEGAREYTVPSRLHKGQFYVLPQSPQQFKQLLMVAGMEKYFQIARCFRDEDQRGDRQPEFTQLDLEMSFVEEEDILILVEKMIIDLVKKINEKNNKKFKIKEHPFPRLTFKQAKETYYSDKPDLRKDKNNANELAFCWVVDFPLFEWSETEGHCVSSHHPFTSPKPEDIKETMKADPKNQKELLKIKASSYDLVLNGYELGSGSIRISDTGLQHQIFNLLGLKEKEIQNRFGHILEAFQYGVPPHGGIALGLDRLVMLLAQEDNIREVIAFPKNNDARDLMMNAPSEIDKKQLKELGLK